MGKRSRQHLRLVKGAVREEDALLERFGFYFHLHRAVWVDKFGNRYDEGRPEALEAARELERIERVGHA
jgi:hypothetical protein